MPARLEWKQHAGSVVYHKRTDESKVVAVASYHGSSGLFNLRFSSDCQLPSGVAQIVFGIDLQTAEWLALAVAEHNECV